MRIREGLILAAFSGAAIVGTASPSEAALIYSFDATVTRFEPVSFMWVDPDSGGSTGHAESMPVGSVHAGRLVVPATPETYEEFDLIECRIGGLWCGSPGAFYTARGPDLYGFGQTGWRFEINVSDQRQSSWWTLEGLSATYFDDNLVQVGESVFLGKYIDFSISNVAIVDTDPAPVPLPPPAFALLAAILPLVWRRRRP